MPKKRTRDNPPNRATRTVQSAGSVLQRMSARAQVTAVAVGSETVAIQRLCGALPDLLRAHLVGCVEKAEEVVLLVDSAAWAARLKLLLADAPPIGDTRRITVRIMPRKP